MVTVFKIQMKMEYPTDPYVVSPRFVGNVINSDNNIDIDGYSEVISLEVSEERTDIDAGLYVPAVIGNQVWFDELGGAMNMFDAGDKGIGGVTVNLWDVDRDEMMMTVVTDEAGGFLFKAPAGRYKLQFISPSGYSLVPKDFLDDDRQDSDADPVTGFTDVYTITSGQVNLTIDAGYSITVPVDWVDFWGENRTDFNYIEWKVANELNVSHYEIERSIDGVSDFEIIHQVPSQGDNTDIQVYPWDDYDIDTPGGYYYRIRQVDYDGQSSMSKIILIDVEETKEDIRDVEVYPNPITPGDVLNVDITTNSDHDVTGEIYDMKGALIKTIEAMEIQSGITNLQIDVNEFAAGAYIVRVKLSEKVFIEKITKVD